MSTKDFCAVVVDNNCVAPPGVRTGMGAIYRGFRKVKTKCSKCERYVCKACSSLIAGVKGSHAKQTRVCAECLEEGKR